MRTVYVNGQFVPEAEAQLSIYDLSVMQACAAFEMTRSFNGVHFKLREHLTRLVRSCRLLSIPLETFSFGDTYDQCIEVSKRNDHGPGEEHRLLIVVSPGCAPMYRDLAGVIPHPFLYIADFPLRYTVQGFSTYFLGGVHCVTSPVQQVPDACVPSAAKHRSRLHFHLAQQQAPPGTWPILRDARGAYCEASGANLVTVRTDRHGCQTVGCLDAQALPGMSMETVRALTGGHSETWRHGQRRPQELWLTATPFCMLPVVSLDGKPIGDGTIGPVFKETLGKWSEMVGVDIQQQIIDWDTQQVWTPDAQRLVTN
jgi:branched-chain amino acid aminotransferase